MFDATQLRLLLLNVRKGRRRIVSVRPATTPACDDHPARQAFSGIASSWGLTATEALRLLGEPLSSEAERLDRLQGILGAHRSLLLIAPEPARYAGLLCRSDPGLDGVSLVTIMLQQGLPAIARARAYLLAQIAR